MPREEEIFSAAVALPGAFTGMQRHPPSSASGGRPSWRQRLSETAGCLARLYAATNQPAKADGWSKQRDTCAAPEPPAK